MLLGGLGRRTAHEGIQNRTSNARPDPNYPRLHDIARHAIHVQETLEVAVVTIENMILEHEHFFLEWSNGESVDVPQQAQKRLHFYLHVMKSLKNRAQASKERLINEITLVSKKRTCGPITLTCLGIQYSGTVRQQNIGSSRTGGTE